MVLNTYYLYTFAIVIFLMTWSISNINTSYQHTLANNSTHMFTHCNTACIILCWLRNLSRLQYWWILFQSDKYYYIKRHENDKLRPIDLSKWTFPFLGMIDIKLELGLADSKINAIFPRTYSELVTVTGLKLRSLCLQIIYSLYHNILHFEMYRS